MGTWLVTMAPGETDLDGPAGDRLCGGLVFDCMADGRLLLDDVHARGDAYIEAAMDADFRVVAHEPVTVLGPAVDCQWKKVVTVGGFSLLLAADEAEFLAQPLPAPR